MSSQGQGGGDDFATFTPPGAVPVLQNIFQVSAEFLGQLRVWLAQNPSDIPLSSITGFVQTTGRAVRGAIPALGTTPSAGIGFTYTHAAVGVYVFTFDAAFSTIPAVTVTPIAAYVLITLTAVGATGFTVNAVTQALAAADTAFSFIAMQTGT